MSQYNKEYFIKKFKAIPKNQWCQGVTTRKAVVRKFFGLKKMVVEQHCALGHCGLNEKMMHKGLVTVEALALIELFSGKTQPHDSPNYAAVYSVNDFTENPKKATLHYLKNNIKP